MLLTVADRREAIQIYRQIYKLWSSGLTKSDYHYSFWSNYYQTWSKQNSYRLVHKDKEEIITSCKIAHFPLLTKGREYKIWGLSAIYTADARRNEGLATNLVKSIINRAKQEEIDAILLYSVIEKEFYAAHGFLSLGNLDFDLNPNIYAFEQTNTAKTNEKVNQYLENISIDIRSAEGLIQQARQKKIKEKSPIFHFSSFSPWLSEAELLELIRCHKRWISRQPYGIVRHKDYFAFQLAKLLYFAAFSKNNKPTLFLTILRNKAELMGYAITECSGTSMRILELIGSDEARAHLWQSLIERAKTMNFIRICGFESIARDFIPSVRLDCQFFKIRPMIKPRHIQCSERLWSQPMLLPLNQELTNIPNYHPCPLLEFDYF